MHFEPGKFVSHRGVEGMGTLDERMLIVIDIERLMLGDAMGLVASPANS